MKHGLLAVLGAIQLVGISSTVAAQIFELTFFNNVYRNSGFETGTSASDSTEVHPPQSWAPTPSATVVRYGAEGDFPHAGDGRGAQFIAGGPGAGQSVLSQHLTVTTPFAQQQIDEGAVYYEVRGWFGGASDQRDYAVLVVAFLDQERNSLEIVELGRVTPEEREESTMLLLRGASGLVPSDTRFVDSFLFLSRRDGQYNNGYADELELRFIYPDAIARATWAAVKCRYR